MSCGSRRCSYANIHTHNITPSSALIHLAGCLEDGLDRIQLGDTLSPHWRSPSPHPAETLLRKGARGFEGLVCLAILPHRLILLLLSLLEQLFSAAERRCDVAIQLGLGRLRGQALGRGKPLVEPGTDA